MREKLRPWIAMMFCAGLGMIVIITDLHLAFTNGTSTPSVAFVYYCFLPMCFFHVGDFLSTLQKENQALQLQIDKLSSQLTAMGIEK